MPILKTDIIYYLEFTQAIPFPDDIANNVTFTYGSATNANALFDDGGALINTYNDLAEYVAALNAQQTLFTFYVIPTQERKRILSPNTVIGVRSNERVIPESWRDVVTMDWNAGATINDPKLSLLYPNVLAQDQATFLLSKVSESLTPGDSAVTTQPASSALVITLAAADPLRKTIEIVNTDTNIMYIKKGSTATALDWTKRLAQYESYTITDYSGIVTAIWASAGAGGANVTITS